jgi:Nucleotidyl transferase AbiEii toxin, Type IV TA system
VRQRRRVGAGPGKARRHGPPETATIAEHAGDARVDYEDIRRLVIVAVFAEPVLFERLVVKGGNALRIVHRIGPRTSLDVDFSTPGDLDEADTRVRMLRTLRDRFDAAGFEVFDFSLEPRPPRPQDPVMAGYEASFKVIERPKARAFGADRERMRREAATVGPGQRRSFAIQISSHEFCGGAEELELDDLVVRVYSPTMIAIEKYRAICQQHPRYGLRTRPTARARDFFDIHSIITSRSIDLGSEAGRRLFQAVFAAKRVPLELLGAIRDQREFHRDDWPSVEQSVAGSVESFDFYFDFALDRIPDL